MRFTGLCCFLIGLVFGIVWTGCDRPSIFGVGATSAQLDVDAGGRGWQVWAELPVAARIDQSVMEFMVSPIVLGEEWWNLNIVHPVSFEEGYYRVSFHARADSGSASFVFDVTETSGWQKAVSHEGKVNETGTLFDFVFTFGGVATLGPLDGIISFSPRTLDAFIIRGLTIARVQSVE